MIPQSAALKALEKYDIDQNQLDLWEAELGIDVPLDQKGNKLYSQLHVNLFKNIKKHLALGRTFDDVKRMVILPDVAHTDVLETSYGYEDYSLTSGMASPLAPGVTRPDYALRQDNAEKKPLTQRLLEKIQPVVEKLSPGDAAPISIPSAGLSEVRSQKTDGLIYQSPKKFSSSQLPKKTLGSILLAKLSLR